ncbi:MAG: NAD(P)H-hydrate dehydratase [Opitutales bacterium]
MYYDNILSAKDSQAFEEQYFSSAKRDELSVIREVGSKIAEDFLSEKYFNKAIKSLLLLLGKGHNASDGLAFLLAMKSQLCATKIYILECFDRDSLKANTKLLLDELLGQGLDIIFINKEELESLNVDIIIEAIAAMRTKPSLSEYFQDILLKVNDLDALKITIDMPFGISKEEVSLAFKADYTYATAIAKSEIFLDCNAQYTGRIRYIDMGFFKGQKQGEYCIYSPQNLDFFDKPRRALSDKRDYGFLIVVGGSMEYKGAVLLNVQSALRSSVGLLRAFVPEALEVAYAVKEPSAMYTGCSTCPEGYLSLENFFLIKKYLSKATAILIGSGIGQSLETKALVAEIIKSSTCPIILDADAINPANLELLKTKDNALITPHNGEFLRLAKDCSNEELLRVSKEYGVNILLKGRYVRACDGEQIVINAMASPALARGSTGDILAGIAGGLIANKELNLSILDKALSAYAILAKSSHKLVAKYGENGFSASQLIEYLNKTNLEDYE